MPVDKQGSIWYQWQNTETHINLEHYEKGEFGRALHIEFETVYAIVDFQLISFWNKPTMTLWTKIDENSVDRKLAKFNSLSSILSIGDLSTKIQ